MASARSSRRRSSSAGTVHLLGEPQQCPTSRFSCGFRRRLPECLGQFAVGIPNLDASDDDFALLRAQSPERVLVILDCLTTDRLFQRRSGTEVFEIVDVRNRGLSCPTPQFIAKPI